VVEGVVVMKVLVTGGAGFIGSHVVDAFVEAGNEVVVVDDLSVGRRSNLNKKAVFREVDIRSGELENVFVEEHPDIVSHQAAKANVRESMEKPLLYADVNVLGSLNLLELCRKHGVKKVIYASTGGACYGEPQYLPVDEDHPVNPLDPYGASKHHVEHYLHLYWLNYKLPYTILRYPNVYGPRQDPLGEAGVVAIFIGKMLKGEQAVIFGSGEQERDFVYVGDIARANVVAADAPAGIFNIGSGVGTNVNTIFAEIRRATGYHREAVHSAAKAGEVFKIYLNAGKANRELGWRPSISLAEGIERTVASFKS
jgi:UDP-glucose 4-epimerase